MAWPRWPAARRIFSGYTLFTAYERSAFAEMTGGFWVPLMLCWFSAKTEAGAGRLNPRSALIAIRAPAGARGCGGVAL